MILGTPGELLRLLGSEKMVVEYHQILSPSDELLFSARTIWGERIRASPEFAKYKDFRFGHLSIPRASIYPNSFAEKNPALLYLLEDMGQLSITPEFFSREFLSTHRKLAQASDWYDFYQLIYKKLVDGTNEIFNELLRITLNAEENTKPIETMRASALEEIQKAIRRNIEVTRTSPLEHQKKFAQELYNRASGAISEIRGAITLPDIKSISVRLSELPEFTFKLKKKTEALKADKNLLNQAIMKYPRIFQDPESIKKAIHLAHPQLTVSGLGVMNTALSASSNYSTWDLLEAANQYISEKEIDLFDGHALIEVKSKSLNMGSFTLKSGKWQESDENQLMTMKDIIEYLGLPYQYKVMITGKNSASVRNKITSRGIEIIQEPAHSIPYFDEAP